MTTCNCTLDAARLMLADYTSICSKKYTATCAAEPRSGPGCRSSQIVTPRLLQPTTPRGNRPQQPSSPPSPPKSTFQTWCPICLEDDAVTMNVLRHITSEAVDRAFSALKELAIDNLLHTILKDLIGMELVVLLVDGAGNAMNLAQGVPGLGFAVLSIIELATDHEGKIARMADRLYKVRDKGVVSPRRLRMQEQYEAGRPENSVEGYRTVISVVK
ncbi:hypothetical protein HDU96_001839 [Phlyctochytrium bullatum]|nr:hypothetical protein HDU96_001839 [Phlyctochytrium bullatum]